MSVGVVSVRIGPVAVIRRLSLTLNLLMEKGSSRVGRSPSCRRWGARGRVGGGNVKRSTAELRPQVWGRRELHPRPLDPESKYPTPAHRAPHGLKLWPSRDQV